MIKAIVFDLDNTLVDFIATKELCCRAAVNAMIKAGLPLSEKNALKKLMALYWKHGIESQDIFQRFLEKELKKIDYKILASAIAAYRSTKAGNLTPYPNVRQTLLKIREKGLKIGIVSDAPRMQAWLRLVEMGLADFFDAVVAFEDTGEKKPSEKPFLAITKKLGVKPSEILFVGDDAKKDIFGAKNIGMKTVLAKYGVSKYTKTKKKIKADFEINDFKELLEVV
jgi:putative hydrolase of the HAD superfamily